MKNFLCILVVSVLSASAQAASLLPAGANDQVPAVLSAPRAKALTATLDRVPVRISHALDANAALDTAAPYVAQSREFWSEVGETELRAGVRLTTTAPGAVVRLSPQGGAGAALDPAGVLVRAAGHTRSAADASAAVADAKALRSAGMAVPEGTLAFRLGADTSGEVEIAAPHAQGRYLVHVFEPASSLVLSLSADHDTVLAGTPVTFRTGVSPGARLKVASGLVTAPDGYSMDLAFARNADGTFSATFTPDAAHRTGPQLWEAHVFTASDSARGSVLRDAKTAFAVSDASARFAGGVRFEQRTDGVHVNLDLASTSASRYQISAVLYGTGTDGALHAAALAQSAAWIGGDRGSIDLGFDAASLGSLHAPFELRDLRLLDQASMSLIERRERALRID